MDHNGNSALGSALKYKFSLLVSYFILCFSVSPHAASHLFYPEVYGVVYPFQITIFSTRLAWRMGPMLQGFLASFLGSVVFC